MRHTRADDPPPGPPAFCRRDRTTVLWEPPTTGELRRPQAGDRSATVAQRACAPRIVHRPRCSAMALGSRPAPESARATALPGKGRGDLICVKASAGKLRESLPDA